MAENESKLINGMPNVRLPVPDPTVLTTQQLTTAISSLREVLETRLDAMDKAITLLQISTDRFPAFVDMKVKHLQDLHEEKFKSVQGQFTERDTRTENSSGASTTAINAALQAAKEAVNQQNVSFGLATSKAEAATTKQIDGLQVLIQTGTKAMDEKIEDIKERLTRAEGSEAGQTVAKTTQRDSNSLIVAIIVGSVGGILGIAGLVIALIKMF